MSLLIHQHLHPIGEWGIWKIEESEAFFRKNLQLTIEELEQVNRIKGEGQRLEWLASRYLLHVMSGRTIRGVCLKDEFGKPYLENSEFQISISHSNKYAAVLAAPFLVGIDIQKLVPKIERIAHKFLRPQEADSIKEPYRLEHLHIYWGAKEALYKAYGRRKLDFCQHILVEPFSYQTNKGQFKGKVKKNGFYAEFDMSYELIDNLMLVTALEKLSKT